MSGLSVIPAAFPPSLLRPLPAWMRMRLRSGYTAFTPAVPNDFMSTPSGENFPSNAVQFSNWTWATNVTAPLAYGTNVMRWTHQGVSEKRVAFGAPPFSAAAPIVPPINTAVLNSASSEIRFRVAMAWSGAGTDGADAIFTGFAVSSWNGFGGGGAGNPWADLATESYIGLIINRQSGLVQVACKANGVTGRHVINSLGVAFLPAGVPFIADHRFTAATMTTPARYELRINGIQVADFSFDDPNAPVYNTLSDGIAPVFYSSYWGAGGNTRFEDLLRADVLAGPGANNAAID